LPSFIFQKDVPARLATIDDVVERPAVFNTQRSGDADRLFHARSSIKS
jgi:hypothetical protein